MSALLLQHRDAICRKYSRTLLSTLLSRSSHLLASKSVSVNGVKNILSRWDRLRKMLLLKSNRTVTIQSHSIIKVSQEIQQWLFFDLHCHSLHVIHYSVSKVSKTL